MRTTTNEKGRGGQTTASANTTTAFKFSRKSTSTEAQYERIVQMLESGPKTTLEFRRAGIMAPAARIKELNDRHGAYIPTVNLVMIVDEWGFAHRGIAVYEMIERPQYG